jgi:SRSO17 transposase
VSYDLNPPAQRRLKKYFSGIGNVLRNAAQRASFAMYAMGILCEGERKSVEPIAARACGGQIDQVDATHQRLLHFIGPARWSDREVRLTAARYALRSMTERGPVESAIIDDTGFLKQGNHSVGVKRQYTGSAGKVTNCQVAVSLTLATQRDHIPVDMQLYLPDTWANDESKRKEAHIPDEVQFQTKPQIALAIVGQAVADKLPLGRVLADCAYGDNVVFRQGIRALGLEYGLGIQATTKVYAVNKRGFVHPSPISVGKWTGQLRRRDFRRLSWRDGTNKQLESHFAFRRVIAADDPNEEQMWLVIERSEEKAGKAPKFQYYLVTGPQKMKKKDMVRALKERYRTEQMYQETKGGLGLDHYEGRRYPGWNHHVSVVLSCYAFIVAERVRHFPPSARRPCQADAQQLAA